LLPRNITGGRKAEDEAEPEAFAHMPDDLTVAPFAADAARFGEPVSA
jgi:hypothetical protein